MKRLLNYLIRPSRSFFGFYLLALTVSAQVEPPDSAIVPGGRYVGLKLSYSRLNNSGLLRLITFFDVTGDVSLWSAQASIGYPYCSRRNFVLDIQSDIGFLHNLTYQGGGLSGRPTTERRTKFSPTIPSLTVNVGYRFRHQQR